MILVYVDDLLIFGSKAINPIIAEIRKEIVMDDLAPIDQYLGCGHRIGTVGDTTHVEFDMSSYLKSAIEIYKSKQVSIQIDKWCVVDKTSHQQRSQRTHGQRELS